MHFGIVAYLIPNPIDTYIFGIFDLKTNIFITIFAKVRAQMFAQSQMFLRIPKTNVLFAHS